MQVCVVGGGDQRRLPGEGKTGTTFVRAALSGEERRPAEGQNVTCERSRTKAPIRRGGLGKILGAPNPPPRTPRGGSLVSRARSVEKPLGQVEMSHKGFISTAPFSLSLACCFGAGSPPSHTHRLPCPPPPGGPDGLILHPHPPPRRPWDFLQPPGPTHTPNWGIPNDELSPLSLSFPVLRMRSVISTFEGSSVRPWGKC